MIGAWPLFGWGTHGAAIADFDRAIGLDGRFSDAYLNRGTVRLALGDAEQAAQRLLEGA